MDIGFYSSIVVKINRIELIRSIKHDPALKEN